jgi:hypothetical protein
MFAIVADFDRNQKPKPLPGAGGSLSAAAPDVRAAPSGQECSAEFMN